jgi:hypothetical protein
MQNNKQITTRNLIIIFIVLAVFGIAAKPFLSNIEHQSKVRVLDKIKKSVEHASKTQKLDTTSIIALINPQDSLLASFDENKTYIGFADSIEELKNGKCYFLYTQENEATTTHSTIDNSGC